MELFHQLTDPATHTQLYTDGSLSGEDLTVSCAIYAPGKNLSCSWSLNMLTSGFIAELMGIRQALEAVMELEQKEVTIFTDSKSAVGAINGLTWKDSPVIPEIIKSGTRHNTKGTKVNLTCIPSHVGIINNETVDQLAAEGRVNPSHGHLDNAISPVEKIAVVTKLWKSNVMARIIAEAENKAAVKRCSLGPLPWHLHRNRTIQTTLLRLRSGHNRLNRHMGNEDRNNSKRCPHDCEENESGEYVVLFCLEYSTERTPLRQFLEKNKIAIEWPFVVGLNKNTAAGTQMKIQKLLLTFLIETDLISRV